MHMTKEQVETKLAEFDAKIKLLDAGMQAEIGYVGGQLKHLHDKFGLTAELAIFHYSLVAAKDKLK